MADFDLYLAVDFYSSLLSVSSLPAAFFPVVFPVVLAFFLAIFLPVGLVAAGFDCGLEFDLMEVRREPNDGKSFIVTCYASS